MTDSEIASRVADGITFLAGAGMQEHADAINAILTDGLRRINALIVERDQARQHVDELQDKLASMPDIGKCCCSFEGPGDICNVHSPTVNRLAARVAELEGDLPTDGEEARYTEWATRTPDGTRTRWTFEPYAREAMQINPHLQLDSREIRHFVGNWRPANAAPDHAERNQPQP